MTKKKFSKSFAIAGIILLLLGMILFLTGMSLAGWNFSELSTAVYKQENYTTQQQVTSLDISYNNAEVRILCDPKAQAVSVSYPVCTDRATGAKAQVNITEENGTLFIKEEAKFILINWQFETPTLTVTLPETTLTTLTVRTQNGNISAENIFAENKAEFVTQNGEIRLSQITASDLSIETDAGGIFLEHIECRKIQAETDLGSVHLSGTLTADYAEFISELGDIDLSEGIVNANDIHFSTDMGNISAKLSGKQQDYSADVTWDMGSTNLYPYQGGDKQITVNSSFGNIDITFSD